MARINGWTIVAAGSLLGASAAPLWGEARVWREEDGGNGHAYDVIVAPAGISWADARTVAELLGGWLVTVGSGEENAFVFSLVVGVEGAWSTHVLEGGPSVTLGPWLGGVRHPGGKEPGSNWAWTTGEDIAASGAWWAPGEPNNRPDRTSQTGEDRLCYLGINGKPSPFWNDMEACPSGTGGEPGLRVTAFVVEFDPMPAGR